jgi:hypothetical protein
MRHIGLSHPSAAGPVPADHMAVAVLAAGTAQAFEYPSGTHLVRLAGVTTAGAAYGFVFNALSSEARWPAASTMTTGSTALNIVIPPGGSMFYQIPGNGTAGTTIFSLIGGTSGIVSVEFWRR